MPTLPIDLVEEIMCRLPVKLLLQLRCICKSWKYLISDPKFATKHLQMSKASQDRHHLILCAQSTSIIYSRNLLLWDSSIPSVFSTQSTSSITQTLLNRPNIFNKVIGNNIHVFSCDGILCFTINGHFPLLWNPSIRRFNVFPPLKYTRRGGKRNSRSLYSFGYDHFTHTYKIIGLSFFDDKNNEVSVFTLGTGYWKRIDDLPYSGSINKPGVFVSGTINWLASDDLSISSHNIVSLDLEKESYQKLLVPNVETNSWTLGVLKNRLCIYTSIDMFVDIWFMNECGNKESWTKLYRIPHMGDQGVYSYDKALYITEDDQVLMYLRYWRQFRLVVYDSKSGTFNMPQLQNNNGLMSPEVYIESLISPCS